MHLIKASRDKHLAIPVNHISFIKWEEMSGGRALVKIGTGGSTHHIDFDTIEDAMRFYDVVLEEIEKL